MQKQVIEMFEQSTATTMESARRIGELNQRTFDKMFQQQAELAAFFMDASVRSLELMSKAKGYQDLLAGQTSLMRECGERSISAVRSSIELATETGTEYGNLAQEGFKIAKDQMTQATANLKAAV
jgi:phasin family protein